MTSADAGRYPRTIHGEAGDLQLRYMTAADEAAVLAFARALPDHDLLFLPRDIAQPKVLAAWIAEIERGGSADKQELVLKGGHVSVVAGRNAVQRLWPKLDAWLGERSI